MVGGTKKRNDQKMLGAKKKRRQKWKQENAEKKGEKDMSQKWMDVSRRKVKQTKPIHDLEKHGLRCHWCSGYRIEGFEKIE